MLHTEIKPGDTVIFNGEKAVVKKFTTHRSQNEELLYYSLEMKPCSTQYEDIHKTITSSG